MAEPTTFEVADVQWNEGPTIMMQGKPDGGFAKNLFQQSRATATIPMESARALPAGALEITVVTSGADRRCDVAPKERLPTSALSAARQRVAPDGGRCCDYVPTL